MHFQEVQTILNIDLRLKPYEVQLGQKRKVTDFAARLSFSDDADLPENIFMSDEVHFHMCSYVNKQNSLTDLK